MSDSENIVHIDNRRKLPPEAIDAYERLQSFPASFVNDLAIASTVSLGTTQAEMDSDLFRLVLSDHFAPGVIDPEVRGAYIVSRASLRGFVEKVTRALEASSNKMGPSPAKMD